MRLIGRPQLARLADEAGADLREGVRALAAEIGSAEWKSSRDLELAFPDARIEKHRVFVVLDEHHCAVIIVNYERSVAVVEYAGANAGYAKKASTVAKPGRRK